MYDVTGVGLARADGILLLADLVKHSEYLKLILKPLVIPLTKYSASLESGCVASKDDNTWALRGEIIDHLTYSVSSLMSVSLTCW